MSTAVLILGESGSGKSTAIRTLPPEETFIINILDKSLPFKGAFNKYTRLSTDGTTGNYYSTDNHAAIMRVINLVNSKREDIKYLIIDDFGYSLTSQFMSKALQKGYDKFSELAHDAWEVLRLLTTMRDNLFVFVMMHSDTDMNGKSKPKTIGKMLDERVCVEGMFTIVLHSICIDGQYRFLTNNTGNFMAKSPHEMFPTISVNNDLKLVTDHIIDYYNKDIL